LPINNAKLDPKQMLQRWTQSQALEPIWAAISAAAKSGQAVVTAARQIFPSGHPPVRVEPGALRPPRPQAPLADNLPAVQRLLPDFDADPLDPDNARISVLVRVPIDPTQGRTRSSGLVVAQIFYQRLVYPRQAADPDDRPIALKPLDHRDLEEWGLAPRLTPAGTEHIEAVNLHFLAGQGSDGSIHAELLAAEATGGLVAASHDTYRVSFRGVGRGDAVVVLDTDGGEIHAAGMPAGTTYAAYRIDRDRLTPFEIDVDDEQLGPLWTAMYDGPATAARPRRKHWTQGDGSLTAWLKSNGFPPDAFPGRFDPAARLTPLLLLAYDQALRDAARSGSALAAPSFPRFARDPAACRFLCERADVTAVLRAPPAEEAEGLSGHLAHRIAAALGRPDLFARDVDGPAQLALFRLLEERGAARLDRAIRAGLRFDAQGWSPDALDAGVLADLSKILDEADDCREILEDYGEAENAALIADYQDKRRRGGTILASEAGVLRAAAQRARTLVARADDAVSGEPEVAAPVPSAPPAKQPPLKALQDELRALLDRAAAIGTPDLLTLVEQFRKALDGADGRSRRFCRGAIRRLRTALAAPNMSSAFASVASGLEAWAALDRATPTDGAEADPASRRQAIGSLTGQARLPMVGSTEHPHLARTHRAMVKDIKTVLGRYAEPGGEVDDEAVALLSDYARVLIYHRIYVAMQAQLKRAALDAAQDGEPQRLLRRLLLWPHQAEITVDKFDNWTRRRGGRSAADSLIWSPGRLLGETAGQPGQ
jgi:hypothetical protein